MEIIGRSPVSPPLLIAGKAAFLVCGVYPLFGSFGSIHPVLHTSGVILYAAGACILLAALMTLGRSATVGLPKRVTELRTTGLYQFTRNPVYVGAYILCAGSCIMAPHPANFASFAAAVFIHDRVVRKEEKFLAARFGSVWTDYASRVPRYFGFM